MSIELRQGEKISAEELRFINKGEPIQKVRLDLAWEICADGDGSVVLLGNDGMMWAEDSLVFYNKRESNDGAIKHTGDNHDGVSECHDGEEGDEIILMDLRRVSVKTHTILAVITLYLSGNCSNQARHFGELQNAAVKLYSQGQDGSQLLCSYELTEGVSVCTAFAMASLTRDGDGWSFQAIGQGIGEGFKQNGLEEVLKKYSFWI